jgi:light-regulated signal transduction histidine kinase (bacteriophytochrome)
VPAQQQALETSLSHGVASLEDTAVFELEILRRGVRIIAQSVREIHKQTRELYLDQFARGGRQPRIVQSLVRTVEKSSQAIDPLSRIATATLTGIHRQRVDLSALMSTLLAKSIGPPPQMIDTKVQPGLHVDADAGLLRDALAFLVDSAVRSTRTRNPGSIQFGRAAHADQTVFYIRDNGTGLNTDHAQGSGAAQSSIRGLDIGEEGGLGLLAVELIFAHHGGRLWIDSAADVGTTFYFTLPG